MKKLLVVLVLLGAGLAGAVYWLNAPRQVHVHEDLFTFNSVAFGDIAEVVSATGAVKPRDVLVITSETAGSVLEVMADVNATVNEGDVLVRLDDNFAKLKVEQAEIGIKTAQAAVTQALALQVAAEKSLKYQQDLATSGFRKELEKAEIELAAAKANVEMAQAKQKDAENQHKQAVLARDKTELKVPLLPSSLSTGMGAKKRDYLILERNVKVGQMVGPVGNGPLFLLAGNLAQLEIHTEVVEGDIGRVRSGQPVHFSISSFDDPDLKFDGTVREILPVPSNVKGAVYYNAVIDVANQKNASTNEWWLRPGMTTAVDVVVQQRKGVWKVPMTALNFQLEEAYQTTAAAERLAEFNQRPNAKDWRPVWTWQADAGRAWPVFVRLSDSAKGMKGLHDGEYHEVLEWEAGATPNPAAPGLRIIVGAPPAKAPGLLERRANFKLS